MDRPTFMLARSSGLPGHIGLCAEDISDVAAAVNEAQLSLMIDPEKPDEGWWGGWVKMVFNLTVTNFAAQIVTPRDIATIIVYDVCQRPRPLRNGFYEYLQFGIGERPRACAPFCDRPQQAFERDNVPLLAPFPATGPQRIRVYITNSADVGKRLIVQGTDQNGNIVYGVDTTTGAAILGERVGFTMPFASSAFQYQTITGLLKDVTLGPVLIFAVDSNGNQTQISSMEPSETSAAYRLFQLDGLPPNCCNTPTGQVQVQAQCKLDFVPVQSDTDYLCIPNIPALDEECQARYFSRIDTTTAAKLEAKHHARAISYLVGQLDHQMGKVRTAISVPLFGSAKLRPNPV